MFPPVDTFFRPLPAGLAESTYFISGASAHRYGNYGAWDEWGQLYHFSNTSDTLLSVEYTSLNFLPPQRSSAELGSSHWGCVDNNAQQALVFHNLNYKGLDSAHAFVLVDLQSMHAIAHVTSLSISNPMFLSSKFVVCDSQWISTSTFQSIAHDFAAPFLVDTSSSSAVAWRDGWMYRFTPSGRVIDSLPSYVTRPTAMAWLPNRVIVAGYSDGRVRLHGSFPFVEATLDTVLKPIPQANSAEVYPNPWSDQVTVSLGQSVEMPALVELLDIRGNELYTATSSQRSVVVDSNSPGYSLSDGVYILRITSPNTRIVRMLIHNR